MITLVGAGSEPARTKPALTGNGDMICQNSVRIMVYPLGNNGRFPIGLGL